jgi:hypothetical protein
MRVAMFFAAAFWIVFIMTMGAKAQELVLPGATVNGTLVGSNTGSANPNGSPGGGWGAGQAGISGPVSNTVSNGAPTTGLPAASSNTTDTTSTLSLRKK